MSPELSFNPESRPSHPVLQEGKDFLDMTELHRIVATRLAELGKSSGEVLLTGYTQTTDGDSRSTTFAYDFATAARNIRYGLEDETPYRYALDSIENDKFGVLAVYDATKFFQLGDNHYCVNSESTIEDAVLFKVRLTSSSEPWYGASFHA